MCDVHGHVTSFLQVRNAHFGQNVFSKIKEEQIKQLFCTANNIILHLHSGVSWDRSLDYYNWFTPFIGTTYKSQLYLKVCWNLRPAMKVINWLLVAVRRLYTRLIEFYAKVLHIAECAAVLSWWSGQRTEIIGFDVQILAPAFYILKCPWAWHWTFFAHNGTRQHLAL